jgi:hypothetical protein
MCARQAVRVDQVVTTGHRILRLKQFNAAAPGVSPERVCPVHPLIPSRSLASCDLGLSGIAKEVLP